MAFFTYRRCEFFKRCIDMGFTLKQMIENTKFDELYLRNWYRKNKIEAKLKEEKILNNLNTKGEEENEEDQS